MLTLPPALAPMGAFPQFILYKTAPSVRRPGKTDKFPIDWRTGSVQNAHDPAIWLDANTALATAAAWGAPYGAGFVFTKADPFWFCDLDNCLQPDGTWSPLSQTIVAALPGAAIEVSQSGRGLHLFGQGAVPAHACKNEPLGLEFYHEERFVALTGDGAMGSAAADCTSSLPSVINAYFPPRTASDATADDWTDAPDAGWNGPLDDDDLIRRALGSHSINGVFAGRATFRDLWERNVEALARTYPDKDRVYNESAADQALAQHLAFWTGRDCERILRLMMRSGLVREKWQRDDYLRELTIPNARRMQREVLSDKTIEPVAGPAASDEAPVPHVVTGSTIAGIPEQLSMFRGCVYVSETNRVLTPGGHMLKPDQFRVRFGGYNFALDAANSRFSRDAWEAFTQSEALRAPYANGMCFRPDLAHGALVDEFDNVLVNTYWPIHTPRSVGDVSKFLAHLKKVLPNDRDRLILLSFMAACVQYPGFKIKWAPLLQGVEGNGKTLFSLCLAEAIGRRYTHYPKAQQLAKNFNAWMYGRMFIGVEDIYVPESKEDVIEALKPMITGESIEIESKGIDQITRWICCNFLLNSNHKSALRKTRNDRRFAVMFCAQQYAADLARDGMTGDYFPDLYDWLRGSGKYAGQPSGFAIVTELLHTFPIPAEFDPRGACQRAPLTTSTEEAIGLSLGRVEQEVLEAIEQELPGFAGGWVSSMALDRLLAGTNAARSIPLNKRRDMMVALGYDWHPALTLGRVDNTVLPDNGKPKLFIKDGHSALNITRPALVAQAYSAAQTPGVKTTC